MATPAVQVHLAATGAEAAVTSLAEFTAFVRQEWEAYGKLVRKHACIDGPEIDAHIIDWDKFLPRFNKFKSQEQESRVKHGLA